MYGYDTNGAPHSRETYVMAHGEDSLDDKGRPALHTLSERALLVEMVTTLRHIVDGIEHLSEQAKSNPMMRGLLGL